LLHAASSLSPCSPIINAWTLRLSISRCSPNRYLNRPVSRTVPEPITRFAGYPDSLSAISVSISTGLDTIRRIPPKSRFFISPMMDFIIAAFFLIRSRRVSPGFWLAPAVITIMAASVMSS